MRLTSNSPPSSSTNSSSMNAKASSSSSFDSFTPNPSSNPNPSTLSLPTNSSIYSSTNPFAIVTSSTDDDDDDDDGVSTPPPSYASTTRSTSTSNSNLNPLRPDWDSSSEPNTNTDTNTTALSKSTGASFFADAKNVIFSGGSTVNNFEKDYHAVYYNDHSTHTGSGYNTSSIYNGHNAFNTHPGVHDAYSTGNTNVNSNCGRTYYRHTGADGVAHEFSYPTPGFPPGFTPSSTSGFNSGFPGPSCSMPTPMPNNTGYGHDPLSVRGVGNRHTVVNNNSHNRNFYHYNDSIPGVHPVYDMPHANAHDVHNPQDAYYVPHVNASSTQCSNGNNYSQFRSSFTGRGEYRQDQGQGDNAAAQGSYNNNMYTNAKDTRSTGNGTATSSPWLGGSAIHSTSPSPSTSASRNPFRTLHFHPTPGFDGNDLPDLNHTVLHGVEIHTVGGQRVVDGQQVGGTGTVNIRNMTEAEVRAQEEYWAAFDRNIERIFESGSGSLGRW
ncbi:hypothetical protein D9758_013895 [Tetrapyrgos nigripes]|uniref:Uncharacterized protein n=1 Tax=Tetrapyrgos nigripes TaxID=182062 RepID=A0A8H5CPG9_9AGAR|nr:hypothetical protein D9758_013895 [Tetrapyrgos nigripes]